MKIHFFPKTRSGKAAAILSLIFIILMAIKLSALAMLIRFPLPSPFIAVIGLAGFVSGMISILKEKEKVIFILFSILIGLLILFWILAEIVAPH